MCKSPEAGAHLVSLGNRKKVDVTGAGPGPKSRRVQRYLGNFCEDPSPKESRRRSLPGMPQLDPIPGQGGRSVGKLQTPQDLFPQNSAPNRNSAEF